MTSITSIQDLIDELDRLKAYGVRVPESSYAHARQADIRLYSQLERREAALLVLRRAASPLLGKLP